MPPIDTAMPSPTAAAVPDPAGPGDGLRAGSGQAGDRAAGRGGGNDRRCAVTRRTGARAGMIRFVVAPDGALTPDLAETLPGRGLWIAASRAALAAPGLAKAAARSARRPVSAPGDLAATVERLLAQRCIATLGLARRAGLVESGFEKVRAALAGGGAMLMLTARDSAGRDGRELARRAAGRPEQVRTAAVLDSDELGAAFGRERLVHVAVAGSALADRLHRDLQRLAGLRTGGAADETDGTAEAAAAASGGNDETAHGTAQER